MPFIPALRTAKVAIEQTLGGVPVINTFWVQNSVPWVVSSLQALTVAVRDWYAANVLGALDHELELTGITATDWTTAFASQVHLAVIPGGSGGDPQPSLPANAAYVVAFRSDVRGRSFRGRVYLAGIPQDKRASPNSVIPEFGNGVTAGWAALPAALAAAGSFTHVIASFRTGRAPRASADLTAVSTYTSDLGIDSQRRRLGSG